MHTLLVASNVLLAALSSYLALIMLRRFNDWRSRRDLQVGILLVPMLSLALGIGALHHFVNQECFLSAPTWDYVLGALVPLSMGLIALAGLGSGVLRLALLHWILGRRSVRATQELQALADRQAEQLGVCSPRLLLSPYNRPLALVYGLQQPTMLLSTWMVQQLDRRELEAVLAHELGHVARRDYFMIWLATILRDAFFYLPTSWRAYLQLQREKELACDDIAVGLTKRPLALASALAKVWQHTPGGPVFDVAQAFTGVGRLIEHRIERLLTMPHTTVEKTRAPLTALSINGLIALTLLILEAINIAVILAPMGCGPVAWLR